MAPFIEQLRQLEAEAVAALEPSRQEHSAIIEEYRADTEPYDGRLTELWGQIHDLADTADFELPERPTPDVDPDEDDVLFDSRRHWWDQLHRYRQEQHRGPIQAIGRAATCETCGAEFTARRKSARFCSDTCRGKARNKIRVDRPCGQCGTTFTPPRADAIYCSRSCRNKANRQGGRR
jgi:hypothetical protein